MNKKRLYIGYISIGILYILVKMVFVLSGYLHPGAIMHGAIPGILTIAVGFFAKKENIINPQKQIWHKVMITLPFLVLIITPLYMYIREQEMWLDHGRFPVLIIYECLAILQIILAFGSRRKK